MIIRAVALLAEEIEALFLLILSQYNPDVRFFIAHIVESLFISALHEEQRTFFHVHIPEENKIIDLM